MASFPELTKRGEAAVKVSEGDIPYVYDDAVFPTRPYKRGTKVKGNLTAGVGHLLSRGNNIFPEADQWIGKASIPQSVRDQWFDADTDIAERAVHQGVKVKLAPHQRDTLISFTFNVGVAAFNGSTLLKKLNRGDYNSVPTELQKWTKTTINGKKITSKGLVKRRADEIAMWLSGSIPEERVTRDDEQLTGTQIGEPDRETISIGEAVSGAGMVVGGAAGFATATGPVAWAFFALAVAAIVIGGAFVIKRYFFDNRPSPTPLGA